MTKDTFGIKEENQNGREIIHKKVDELNRNNRENNKLVTSGIMPSRPAGDP